MVSYFRFRKSCLQNDKAQRKLSETLSLNLKRKRKRPLISSKRQKTQQSETDYETDSTFYHHDSDDEYEENLLEFFEREQIDIEDDKMVKNENSNNANIEVQIKNGSSLEEELRELIKNSISEEQAEAENIIIHVENDNEDVTDTLTGIKDLPIVIKPVKPRQQPKLILDIDGYVSSSEENVTDVVSNVGIFKAIHLCYIFNSEFCIIDGYIFEYRMCKEKVR